MIFTSNDEIESFILYYKVVVGFEYFEHQSSHK